MSEEYNDEEFSGLTYAQKLQLEELIIDTAFRNSFKVGY